MDLVYFGYESDSRALEQEFIKTVSDKFPKASLTDAYDSIKGHRQRVDMPKEMEDDYLSWILGHGWHECSLTMQMLFLAPRKERELLRLIDLARNTYPENFKN
ncbi:MAG: hypothetical protein AAF489_17175 [Bacteroidota bacterium]